MHSNASSANQTSFGSKAAVVYEPPSLRTIVIDVEPASREFSIISLTADAGRCTTSPAAIRLTTASSSFMIDGTASLPGDEVAIDDFGCCGEDVAILLHSTQRALSSLPLVRGFVRTKTKMKTKSWLALKSLFLGFQAPRLSNFKLFAQRSNSQPALGRGEKGDTRGRRKKPIDGGTNDGFSTNSQSLKLSNSRRRWEKEGERARERERARRTRENETERKKTVLGLRNEPWTFKQLRTRSAVVVLLPNFQTFKLD